MNTLNRRMYKHTEMFPTSNIKMIIISSPNVGLVGLSKLDNNKKAMPGFSANDRSKISYS